MRPTWSGSAELKSCPAQSAIESEAAAVPNESFPGSQGAYFLSEGGGERSLVYQAGDLDPASWKPSPQGELRWWGHQGKFNWGTFVSPIESIDPATRTIVFPKQDSPAAAGERYYMEGDRELLDAPGEKLSIAALAGASLDNDLPLNIGRNGGRGEVGNRYWPGAIDDLRLFKRVLAPWEVDALAIP